MKLVGLMPVRNEDWILGLSARVALQWCDALVIFLHACTDRSAEIAQQIQDEVEFGPDGLRRVFITSDQFFNWDEMKHRQDLLDCARGQHATHIAMIDADEILTANLIPYGPIERLNPPRYDIRAYVAQLESGQMLELPGYNLRGSLQRYHANGIWGDRWFAVAFKDCPEANWQGDRFHHREPFGLNWRGIKTVSQGQGGVLHLWGASERRLTAKHALYKATERLRYPDKPIIDIELMYNLWRSPADVRKWNNYPQGSWAFADVPFGWWNYTATWPAVLANIAEAANYPPWQEPEVKRLVEEHGRHTFAGLDLFGIA